MPKTRGQHKERMTQEVTRQVSGEVLGSFDSLGNVRSVSPVSAVSCIDSDIKEVDVYRSRVVELERQLSLARKEMELAKISKKDSCSLDSDSEAEKKRPAEKLTMRQDRMVTHATVDLPRVELSPFDGNPEQYCQFIRQYENFIECKTTDPGQRFLYLMHYCRGRAKEAIQGCAMLDPDLGYARARAILKDMFGQPFRVARNMIDGVMNEARRTRGDIRSLSNLVIKMQNCSIALSHLNYRSDLDAMHTLESIVRCLPVELQTSWAIEADRIGHYNREATFDELTEFINAQARIANSRFGQLVRDSNRQTRGSSANMPSGSRSPNQFGTWANTHAISQQTNRPNKCKLCSNNHRLAECPNFTQMNVNERWMVAKRTGSCFMCLSDSHRAALCRSKVKCGEPKCHGNHHPLLHNPERADREDIIGANTTGTDIDPGSRKTVYAIGREAYGPVRLGIVPIKVETPGGLVEAVAFLDNGSDTTLVTENFLKQHNLGGERTSLVINTVNGSQTLRTSRVSLRVTSTAGEEFVEVPCAFSIPDLPMRAMNRINETASRWPHLRDLPLENVPSENVDILIGCDVPEAHWVLDQRIGGRKDPYAVQTALGWVMFGPVTNGDRYRGSVNFVGLSETSLEGELERLYNMEFGDTTEVGVTLSREDQEALTIATVGTRKCEQRYVVPLPWRPGSYKLPNNKRMALQRLHHLRSRLLRDPALRNAYQESMNRNLELGYIEPATDTDPASTQIWYLPHHPVVNPKKPSKMRIVFDCAAKCEGISINDRLLQGPDLTTPLIDVLGRFRLGRFAVAADIQEMFLQVKVPPDQRDALRLWWWPDGDLGMPAKEYRMTVHPFGAVSSPFCANFALRTTASQNAHQFNPAVIDSVINNFYVDDYLGTFDNVEQAVSHVEALTRLLRLGSFRLTKWTTNCREVLVSVPSEDRSPTIRDLYQTVLPTERALGVQWDAEGDSFVFQLHLPDRTPTRRGVLSSLSSLYDPLGFVSPWLLPGKMLLQNLCRKKVEWDDVLGEMDQRVWNDWVQSLLRLGEVKLPRALKGISRGCDAEMHVFSDASESGYGVAAYGVASGPDGKRHSNLLFSKARVTPLKTVSIPRLELTAAVLSVKVVKTLKRCYQTVKWDVHYWTDSAIVLHYIRNSKTRFSTFVANRLASIHDESQVHQWRHVRSADNPADFCSRGLITLEKAPFWFHGPGFLQSTQDAWADRPFPPVAEETLETKRVVLSTVVAAPFALQWLDRFSPWTKLLRVVVWWTRFKQKLTIMTGLRPTRKLNIGPIRPDELCDAEMDVIRALQLHAFPSEISSARDNVRGGNRYPAQNTALKRLCPIVVDGVLQVGGRLTQSALDFDAKHPIILPNNHHITHLLITHTYTREGHAGVNHLLNVIRRRYWIVKGRVAVRRIVGRCIFCQRQNAVLGRQMMADLPESRVKAGWWPFAETGVDYFGPLWVRRRTSREKRYGCLMTCLQSRAVHLELVNSMSTDSFLMAWQRFVARRGTPLNAYSDNGSNFVGAQRELSVWVNRLDRTALQNRTSYPGTRWSFNPPYASHRGGVWERLIRSTRRILTALCGQQTPDDETLSTLLVEVERILNNRPLVPVYSGDPQGLALTPNDLLLLRSNPGLGQARTLRGQYLASWNQANYLAGVFWKRWTSEYLPTLQSRQKWLQQERPIRKGDVVLVAEDKLRRECWPLGVVVDCTAGGDGLIRTATVKTATGEHVRDVRKLCLLEGEGESAAPQSEH